MLAILMYSYCCKIAQVTHFAEHGTKIICKYCYSSFHYSIVDALNPARSCENNRTVCMSETHQFGMILISVLKTKRYNIRTLVPKVRCWCKPFHMPYRFTTQSNLYSHKKSVMIILKLFFYHIGQSMIPNVQI